jgi:PAT family beta-lactamase induction signal transducer AmpG
MGFTSGIPFLLVYSTQSAWLSDVGISLAIIGLLSELTLAYKFKFLWAPFLDRYDPPLFGRALGRRRGWIIVAQLGVMATLAGVALGDPAHRLAWTIVLSLALGFAGATLDLPRSRPCCRPGPRLAGASAISRPAPAPCSWPIGLAGAVPIFAWAR